MFHVKHFAGFILYLNVSREKICKKCVKQIDVSRETLYNRVTERGYTGMGRIIAVAKQKG